MKELREAQKKLTHKQGKFTNALISNGFNATEAAKEAYPNIKTDLTARVMGSENLTKPNIQEAINNSLPDLDSCAKSVTTIQKKCMIKKDYPTALKCVDTHIRMQNGYKESIDLQLKHDPESMLEIDDMRIRLKLLEEHTLDTVECT